MTVNRCYHLIYENINLDKITKNHEIVAGSNSRQTKKLITKNCETVKYLFFDQQVKKTLLTSHGHTTKAEFSFITFVKLMNICFINDQLRKPNRILKPIELMNFFLMSYF